MNMANPTHPDYPDHPDRPKDYTIIVNARKRTVATAKLTYDQVVALAFDPVPTGPNVLITVTYRHGPKENREGELQPGQSVTIKNEMIFNVIPTDKS